MCQVLQKRLTLKNDTNINNTNIDSSNIPDWECCFFFIGTKYVGACPLCKISIDPLKEEVV